MNLGEAFKRLPLFLNNQDMMKKNILVLPLVALLILVMAACSGDKNQHKIASNNTDYLRPASIQYTAQDTAAIQNLVDKYLEYFDKKDFAAASELLYTLRNDSIFPLTSAERDGFVKAMSTFDFYASKQKSFILRSEKNNEVKILMQIIESGDIDKEEGVTTFSLNPVLVEGQWYLTLLNENAEGVENIYEP